jgi:hypothetical protein
VPFVTVPLGIGGPVHVIVDPSIGPPTIRSVTVPEATSSPDGVGPAGPLLPPQAPRTTTVNAIALDRSVVLNTNDLL